MAFTVLPWTAVNTECVVLDLDHPCKASIGAVLRFHVISVSVLSYFPAGIFYVYAADVAQPTFWCKHFVMTTYVLTSRPLRRCPSANGIAIPVHRGHAG